MLTNGIENSGRFGRSKKKGNTSECINIFQENYGWDKPFQLFFYWNNKFFYTNSKRAFSFPSCPLVCHPVTS